MKGAIDLFAGAGGFTVAARMAGIPVVWAANHFPPAVRWHAQNHPETEHACQDLRQANFHDLPPFDLLLASPACQGHGTAGQPARKRSGVVAKKHDEDRSTAWAVIDCAEATLPKAIIVENVVNLLRWTLYPVWREALTRLGYTVTEHQLDAARFRVPQHRVRLFVTAVRKRRAVVVRATHADMVASETIIDPAADGWAPIAEKSAQVQERVAKGRARCGRRFFTQHVTGHPGRRLSEPLRTITTVPGHWNLVDGDLMRTCTVRELARGQSFPDDYELPTQLDLGTHLVGNAVPPLLARAVIEATREAA